MFKGNVSVSNISILLELFTDNKYPFCLSQNFFKLERGKL